LIVLGERTHVDLDQVVVLDRLGEGEPGAVKGTTRVIIYTAKLLREGVEGVELLDLESGGVPVKVGFVFLAG